MNRKSAVGLFSAGVLVGGLAMVLVLRLGRSGDAGPVIGPIAQGGIETTDQIAALRGEYDQRISALTTENKALREQLAKLASALGPGMPMSERPAPISGDEALERRKSVARKSEIEYLLAAGYSMERIEYLQRRAEELAAEFRRSRSDRLSKGLGFADPAKDLGIMVAPDFALKDEIGDAEYERYLAALKRPTAVVVGEVLKGGVADSVGIKPGDEIVTYNNTRVFNRGQLDGLSGPKDSDRPGQQVPITVRRDGQTMQFMVPKGQQLDVRPPLPAVVIPGTPVTPVTPPPAVIRHSDGI
jgi:membrane-associated protease RseP (regulator of RpoE activity)